MGEGQTAQITFTLDLPVGNNTSFTKSDVTIQGGGEISDLVASTNGLTYTGTFTQGSSGNSTIKVEQNKFQNEFGNMNLESNLLTLKLETQRPTVTIAPVDEELGAGQTLQVKFFLSLPVGNNTVFTKDSVEVVNGELSDLVASTDSLTYTGTFTQNGNGDGSLKVLENKFEDSFGNKNLESNELMIMLERTGPYVNITSQTNKLGAQQSTEVTFILSAPASNDMPFTKDSVQVINGTLSDLTTTDNYIYKGTFTQGENGNGSLSVEAGKFSDEYGNQNSPSNSVSIELQTKRPFLTLLSDKKELRVGQTTKVTFVLSEAPNDGSSFTYDHISIRGGTLADFKSESTTKYTAIYTQGDKEDGIITVQENKFRNFYGNGNEASDPLRIDLLGALSVAISNVPESFKYGETFDATITFSEVVTGFEKEEILINNGAVSSLTGSGAIYTASITPSYSNDVSIQIPSNVAQASDGEYNQASNIVIVKNMVAEETSKIIAGYMIDRAHNHNNAQSDLTGFLTSGGGSLNGSGTENNGTFNLHTGYNANAWAKISVAWSENKAAKASYLLGSFGAHFKVNKNLLLGAMVQIDHSEFKADNAKGSGTGWLIGPYVVAKLPDHPLYFEGRLLYGMTHNKINPFGDYEDAFNSKRFYGRVKVAGAVQLGRLTLTPNVVGSYTHDEQQGYKDTLGNLIPKQSIALGELSAGIDFSTPIDVSFGKLNLNGGVSGIYSHSKVTGIVANEFDSSNKIRARVKLGLDYQYNDFVLFGINGFYDGIFVDNEEAYGGNASVSVRF